MRLQGVAGHCWVHRKKGEVFVPPSLRARVFTAVHRGVGAHPGVIKTRRLLQSIVNASVERVAQDVTIYVRQCLVCNRTKRPPSHIREVPTGSLDHTVALDLVSLDHVGPIEIRGTKYYILVMVDHATRYMVAT